MTVREYEQKFIQLERFAPGLCATEKVRTSKFVWGLRFALKDRVANHRARTLAQAVAIACVSEEVLNEKFGPWKEKGKKKLEGTNSNNTKWTTEKEYTTKKIIKEIKEKEIKSHRGDTFCKRSKTESCLVFLSENLNRKKKSNKEKQFQ